MPRKESIDPRAFYEQVAKAFERVPGGTLTTADERREHALRWLSGDHESYIEFAVSREMIPIAFMVACLVDIEHPLIVTELGTLKTGSLLGAGVVVLQTELGAKVVHTPCVQLYTCTQF